MFGGELPVTCYLLPGHPRRARCSGWPCPPCRHQRPIWGSPPSGSTSSYFGASPGATPAAPLPLAALASLDSLTATYCYIIGPLEGPETDPHYPHYPIKCHGVTGSHPIYVLVSERSCSMKASLRIFLSNLIRVVSSSLKSSIIR